MSSTGTSPRSRWLALWAAAVLVSTGLTAGYVLLVRAPQAAEAALREAARELGRVAETRHTMLDHWIRDALADAMTVADFPSVRLQLLADAGRPAGTPDPRLAEILTNFARRQQYAQLALLTPDGRVSMHTADARLHEACSAAARDAVARGRAVVDVHDHVSEPLVGVALPLADSDTALGVVLVEAPLSTFAPLLQPRPTGEGVAAVALFVEDRATGLARPVTIGTQPLSLTALDEADLGAGVPVIGAARDLGEAPWTLAIALPRDAVEAGVNGRLRRTAALWAALVAALLTILLLLFWGREQSLRAALARERSGLMELLDSASDAVLFADASGRIRHCNARAEHLYGQSAQELAGRHGIRDLRPEREHAAGAEQLETVLRDGQLVFETVHRAANGREVPVEISANRVTLGGEQWVVAVVRDITERKAAETRIRRLNRLLRTMSEVRQAIALETDQEVLLSKVCRVAVDAGGFELAWIGRAEPDGGVLPVGVAGPGAGYVEQLSIRWDDTELGRGPVGTAVRGGHTVVVPDVAADPRMAPWRERLLTRSLRSVASSPISSGGVRFGAVSLYAAEPHAFDAEAVGLLEDLAADIGLALERTGQQQLLAGQARQIAEQQRLFERMSAVMPAVLYLFDLRERRVVYANRTVTEMLGYEPAEVQDMAASVIEIVHPDDQALMDGIARFADVADGQMVSYEFRARTSSGEWSWLQCREVVFTRDPDGAPRLVVGVAQDVTERARAAEALSRSEAQFRAVFDYAGLGITLSDLDGRPIRVNPAFARMLGYSEGELQERHFTEFTHPEDLQVELALVDALRRGDRTHYELDKRYLHREGTVIWVTLTVTLVRDGRGQPLYFVVLADDITDRRRLQEQFLQAQKMEGIGRLAGGVAHDFNNLLTAIMGYTELLRADLPADHPSQTFVEEVSKAGARAAALTTQLLAFARRQMIEPRLLDLNAVVRDAEKMLRRLVGEDVEIVFQPGADLGTVEADPGQLDQILVNLAVNARDAMPEGGRLIIETDNAVLDEHYALAHVDVNPGEYVMLAVSDTGVGMSPGVQAKLFEPFFTTKEQGKGTGLGLATCHGIVKQAGGNIHVYSEPGLGTSFRIYLPRVRRPVPVEPRQPVPPTLRGGHELLLLAEDEDAVRHLASLSLRSYGYRVLEAPNGADALALAETHCGEIRLLITDVVMPGMNGRELARRFGGVCPGRAVLFISGHAESAIVHHGVLDPGVAFLPKPFTPERLARRVRELLDAPSPQPPGGH